MSWAHKFTPEPDFISCLRREQDLVPGFRATLEEFYDAGMAMSRRILRLLALSLDLPPPWFLDRFKKPLTTLRLLHYSAQPSKPDEVRDNRFIMGIRDQAHGPLQGWVDATAAFEARCITVRLTGCTVCLRVMPHMCAQLFSQLRK